VISGENLYTNFTLPVSGCTQAKSKAASKSCLTILEKPIMRSFELKVVLIDYIGGPLLATHSY